MKRINIIGAGPSGNYLAYLLSKKGYEVNVFEENKEPGIPVQCTGLVSCAIEDFFKVPKKLIKKRISDVAVLSPKGNALELSFKEPDYILDRAGFDYHLYEQAKKEGAKYHFGSRYISSSFDGKDYSSKIKSYSGNQIKTFRSDFLVGADGPNSLVAKDYGLFGGRKFMYGVQARIKTKHNDRIEFFPYYECFGWIVPESDDVVRTGLVSYSKKTISLQNFLEKELKMKNPKIIDRQGGLIPIFSKKQQYYKGNVFLIGDAAGLVKATTGGGIIQGLTSANILSENLETGKYDYQLKKELLPSLKLHLLVREALDKFNDSDWERLIMLCSDRKVREALNSKSRDYPIKLGLQLLMAKPQLMMFANKLF